MSQREFEQRVTEGKAQWITSISDLANSSALIVNLSHDNERFSVGRVLEFHGVQNVEILWTAREDDRLEGIVSAHENKKDSNGFCYLLVTDQREIRINTERQAIIYDV